ncbi:hypothetical protein PFISCL1PPCAC_3351, partial [Pristionchus fissidentatus]
SSLINFPLVAAPALTALPLLTFFVKSSKSRSNSNTKVSAQKTGTELRLQTRSGVSPATVRPSIQSNALSVSVGFD